MTNALVYILSVRKINKVFVFYLIYFVFYCCDIEQKCGLDVGFMMGCLETSQSGYRDRNIALSTFFRTKKRTISINRTLAASAHLPPFACVESNNHIKHTEDF